ncbi:MAG: ribonuclease Z [Chlamydiia bacterium]
MSLRELAVLGCGSQQHTRERNHNAYLLRWKSEGFLFDPGEGTQRQFIFAKIAPTCVTRIFVSHFHGDHCLGLGAMILRLNLDKVLHEVHIYYPESGKRYFDNLRYSSIYTQTIKIVEHPVKVSKEMTLVDETEEFLIYGAMLNHGIDCVGWRIQEKETRKCQNEKLKECGVHGPMVKELLTKGFVMTPQRRVDIDEVSYVKPGDSVAVVIDTLKCPQAVILAKDVKLLLVESTYLDKERELAEAYKHMTATQAAEIAAEAHAEKMVMTHFSARYSDESPFEEEARKIFPNAFAAKDLIRFTF